MPVQQATGSPIPGKRRPLIVLDSDGPDNVRFTEIYFVLLPSLNLRFNAWLSQRFRERNR